MDTTHTSQLTSASSAIFINGSIDFRLTSMLPKSYRLLHSLPVSHFYVSLAFDGIAARKLNQMSAFGAWVCLLKKIDH
jgi:phosphatidylglycerophosphate synthase